MLRGISIVLAAALTLMVGATSVLARSPRVIDDNDRLSLRGNVHRGARPELDAGAADPAAPMERMVLALKIPPAKKAGLERLLAEQLDPDSPNFKRWLTPEEFAERFGPDPEDVAALTGWLAGRGFRVDRVGRGRTTVEFSGTVEKVERAFRTRIRKYLADGRTRQANDKDPEIPRGLADLVHGIVSLHDFPVPSTMARALAVPGETEPNATFGTDHYLSPADFATIYNLNPLYAAGIDGTGQSIAIVGRANPGTSNWVAFRSSMGLPAKAVEVIVNGPDPGSIPGENTEADLDVEWAGAVARNATIKFVTTKTTATTDGVHLSAQYIVENNVAPVMSTSFGLCESLLGTAENAFYHNLWQQAAAQGITALVSTGDSGAAGCSSGSDPNGFSRAVNGLASTPYNVAVGGTQFNDASGGYWGSSNGTGYSSALSHIPEIAWNESAVNSGSGLWATGGGASDLYVKPSWQVAPGVPAADKRSIPDVSLTAANHVAYLMRSGGGLMAAYGTSASSPAFAGIMALVVQKTGQRLGNANVRLYQLGNAQYGLGGPAVFHDTVSGSNNVPGVTGYSCTAGYDLATGLGSVDATALVNNWAALPLSVATASLPNGTLGSPYSAPLAAAGGTPPYTWSLGQGSLPPGLAVSPAGSVSGTPAATGVFSFALQVTDAAGTVAVKTLSQATSAAVCTSQPVRLTGASTGLFPDLASAYLAAASGTSIELQSLAFGADLLFDREVSVSLAGGSDCGFAASPSTTALLGQLRVTGGTVNLDKLRFR